jgi:hypothetical protein
VSRAAGRGAGLNFTRDKQSSHPPYGGAFDPFDERLRGLELAPPGFFVDHALQAARAHRRPNGPSRIRSEIRSDSPRRHLREQTLLDTELAAEFHERRDTVQQELGTVNAAWSSASSSRPRHRGRA